MAEPGRSRTIAGAHPCVSHMSGHNKWAQIKHKKAATDKKRAQVFSKLSRAISIAARGNPDPDTNARLKSEIDRARAVNMPIENIERAIRRVSEKDATTLEALQLEILGPAGLALIVSAITDNPNRTIGEVRKLASDHGAKMAQEGSLSWMFKKMGIITFPVAPLSVGQAERLELTAIDAGAIDVAADNEQVTVYTQPEDLDVVRGMLGAAGFMPTDAVLSLVPASRVPVPPTARDLLEALISALDDHEDVQDVYVNASDL